MVSKNRIRVVRAEQRVSQREVAALAGLEVTRLWRIENGYAEPTPAERRVLAKALGVTQRELWPSTFESAGAVVQSSPAVA